MFLLRNGPKNLIVKWAKDKEQARRRNQEALLNIAATRIDLRHASGATATAEERIEAVGAASAR